MRDGVQHLHDLTPLMRSVDEPAARYKMHLPENFFCGLVFFELRAENAYRDL